MIYSKELLGSIFRSFQDIFKGVSRICDQEFLGFILRSFLDLFSVSSRIFSQELLNLFSGASRIWSQEFLGSIQRSFQALFSGASKIFSQEFLGAVSNSSTVSRSYQELFPRNLVAVPRIFLGSDPRSFQDLFLGAYRICSQELLGSVLRSS